MQPLQNRKMLAMYQTIILPIDVNNSDAAQTMLNAAQRLSDAPFSGEPYIYDPLRAIKVLACLIPTPIF